LRNFLNQEFFIKRGKKGKKKRRGERIKRSVMGGSVKEEVPSQLAKKDRGVGRKSVGKIGEKRRRSKGKEKLVKG